MRKIIFAFLFLFAFSAHALTLEQKTTLKAAMLADPVASAYATAGNDNLVAAWFNTASDFVAWKTNVTQSEIVSFTSFDWTRVDNLSAGKARIWDWMFRQDGINAAQDNIRAGIAAVWVGTAADLVVRDAVLTMCKRFATNAEKALATGTGTDAVPGVMTFEGALSSNDAYEIRTLP